MELECWRAQFETLVREKAARANLLARQECDLDVLVVKEDRRDNTLVKQKRELELNVNAIHNASELLAK